VVASAAAAQIPKPAFRKQGPGEGGRDPLNCFTAADIQALSNQRGTWEDTKRLLAKSEVFSTEYLNSITNQTEARKLGALWIQTNKQAFQMGARPGPYMTTPTTSPDAQSNGILDVFGVCGTHPFFVRKDADSVGTTWLVNPNTAPDPGRVEELEAQIVALQGENKVLKDSLRNLVGGSP
jgi:hypothetical protein